MKAYYTSSPGQPAGHGSILVTGLNRLEEIADLEFSLKRASDQRILGAAGWQESERPHQPLAAESDGPDLRLLVGPEVTDHLDMRENYRLSLWRPGLPPESGSLVIESICYSPLAGGRNLDLPPAQPEPPARPRTPERPPAAGQPKAGPPQAEPKPEPPKAASGPKTGGLRFRRRFWIPLVLVGMILAWFLGKMFFTVGPPVVGPTAPVPPVALNEAMALARRHIRDQGDLAAGLELADRIRNMPGGADAAFILIEDAAQKGLKEALGPLAQYYDPLQPQAGTIIKDPVLAYQWYQKAEAAGVPGASEKLAALWAWAETGPGRDTFGGEELLNLKP